MLASNLTRRSFLAAAVAVPAAAARPKGFLVDSHIHLFAKDQRRFPFHSNASYRPDSAALPQDLEDYRRFVAESKIDHAVIVHPEPYQDDHAYLEHCFAHEPSPGFFKGTVLFDPIDSATPSRMREMVQRHAGRIVAVRVHAMNPPGQPPLTSGPIKDRDLRDSRFQHVWRLAGELGLAVQIHMLPHHAVDLEPLVREFPSTPVLIDHLARSGMGNGADYEAVLSLARHSNVYMKYSGLSYSSRTGFPFLDAKPVVRRLYDAYGPDRILWAALATRWRPLKPMPRSSMPCSTSRPNPPAPRSAGSPPRSYSASVELAFIAAHRSDLSSSVVSSMRVATVQTCPAGSMIHPTRSPQN